MRGWLNRLFFWVTFPPIIAQKAAQDCQNMKKAKEFPHPYLNSSMNVVTVGQNVSLFCSNKNTSLKMSYSLFWGKNHVETKEGKDGLVTFYLKISTANSSGPYKCKVQVFNCSKYSQHFNFTIASDDNCPSCLLLLLIPGILLGLLAVALILFFWIRPKYKARKAQRENGPKASGDMSAEGELYANICKNQAGQRQPQEVYYATPVFQEVASKEHESYQEGKTVYIYSELVV